MARTRYATDQAVAATVAQTQLTPPAGGTGAAAGAYDTSGNRDLMIASLTAAKTDIANLKVEIAAIRTKLGI